MNSILPILLWLSLGLVAYAYVGFPVLLWVFARLFGRPPVPPPESEEFAPTVSVLISALNEEEVIGQRLENSLAADYPTEQLEVVIASDGSVDRTATIVRDYEARYPKRVRLFDYPQRQGKATALNSSIPRLVGEIVVLSDANTFFDKAAVRNLVRWFADPQVGAVCGKLLLVDSRSGNNVDSMYWRYETLLKQSEGRLRALLGSNGAIYAIRRAEYVPILGDTIIDDFTIPLLIKLHTGKQIVYDEAAVASEETPADVKAEFHRRSRIGAGGFQSLARLWPLLLPKYGWTSFAFLSHKVMRWICPAALAMGFAVNVALAGEPFYLALLALQIIFYSTALIGALIPGNTGPARLLRLATLFTSMNLALAVGFYRWLAGSQRGTWRPTAR